MNDSTEYEIPGLGNVKLGFIGYGYGFILLGSDQITEAEEGDKATVFTNLILSLMLVDPSMAPEGIADFPSEAVTALINIIVDWWGIQEDVDSISIDLPPRERFYQAFIQTSDRLHQMISIVAEEAHKTQQDMANHIAEVVRGITQQLSQQMKEIMQPMQQVAAQVTAQQQAFQQALAQVAEQIAQQQEEIWRNFELLFQEVEVTSAAIGGPLVEAGFWVPPSAPLDLFHLLRGLVDEGEATPERIRQAIMNYYETNDYGFLRDMVHGWRRNPYFADRLHIIDDALDAHIDGKYTLSIPALLPLVEGVLTDIVGEPLRGIRRRAGDVLGGRLSDALREACKDAVVEFVTGIRLYSQVDAAYFTSDRFPEWLNQQGLTGDQVLHRHAILHGVQLDYASRENSLRALFLLDVLSSIWEMQNLGVF